MEKPGPENKDASETEDDDDDDDDDDEHEIEDEFDVSDVKENMNGSMLNTGDVGNDYLKGDTSAIPVAINGSSSSQMSHLQNKKNDANIIANENKWARVQKGTKVLVQVVKEGLGSKGPTLTAYPKLKSRFWVCCDSPLSSLLNSNRS